MKPKLVFVYAVNGGVVAGLFDYVHKLVSPSTYPCSLCALTYGPTGQRAAWARTIADLGVDTEFLHRNEVEPSERAALPSIFIARDGVREPLISKDEIDRCADLDALIALVRSRVADIPMSRAHQR